MPILEAWDIFFLSVRTLLLILLTLNIDSVTDSSLPAILVEFHICFV